MVLYLSKGQSVRLVRVKNITSKAGNNLTFVNVADTSTFENVEFMLDPKRCSPDSLQEGKDYELNVILEGKFTSCVLLPLAAK